jgi:hypothetical protein
MKCNLSDDALHTASNSVHLEEIFFQMSLFGYQLPEGPQTW